MKIGIDVSNGKDFTAIAVTIDGILFSEPLFIPAEPEEPAIRNVTPQPKLLKESNE